jgi:hypothetical protein
MARSVNTFVVAVGIVLGGAAVLSQARVDDRWLTAWNQVENLTVMIGTRSQCSAAGIVVGYDQSTTYVVTAYHAAEKIPASEVVVTFRLKSSRTGLPVLEKTVPAVRGQDDRGADLFVLRVTDADVYRAVSGETKFDVAEDGTRLKRGDGVYAIGCGDAVAWDRPSQLGAVVSTSPGNQSIYVQSDYIREGFSGGPLLHVFGASSFLVGMTLGGPPRARALEVGAILDRLRGWNISTKLTHVGTTPGCVYSLSTAQLMLFSTGREPKTVAVTTGAGCEWVAYTDGTPWLQASYLSSPQSYVPRRGSGTVNVSSSADNPCDSKLRRGSVMVAGRMVLVEQDFSGAASNIGCN